jgi:hypothetical protein
MQNLMCHFEERTNRALRYLIIKCTGEYLIFQVVDVEDYITKEFMTYSHNSVCQGNKVEEVEMVWTWSTHKGARQCCALM